MTTIHIPTQADIAWIKQVALARRQQAKSLGCQDAYGLIPKDEEEAIALDIQGAAGEWALAKEINETWQATLESWRGADHVDRFGMQWQVKCVGKPHHGLVVHPNYNKQDVYVLTHLIDGDLEKGVEIKGWRPAYAIKTLGEWRDNTDGREPFKAIPPRKLSQMEDFEEWCEARLARKTTPNIA